VFSRLIPRDAQFYDLFDQLADHLVTTARMVNDLFADPGRAAEHIKAIKDVEHAADLLTFTINQQIDRSFITPIDREDIHLLATRLDDVIDLLDGAARRMDMLRITEVKPPAAQLAGILMRAAGQIKGAVSGLKKPSIVNQHAAVIKRLEEEGDTIYHDAVAALFAGTPDAIDVIRWKEMYDTLEHAIDSCMGVAQVLQSISFKNA
jgi:uncharacterized protein Yka (UPF0111/DUF47 family)